MDLWWSSIEMSSNRLQTASDESAVESFVGVVGRRSSDAVEVRPSSRERGISSNDAGAVAGGFSLGRTQPRSRGIRQTISRRYVN
jgi:hypothetical protein